MYTYISIFASFQGPARHARVSRSMKTRTGFEAQKYRLPGTAWEGRYKAPWKREFTIPWREAGPPNHLNDKLDSDQ